MAIPQAKKRKSSFKDEDDSLSLLRQKVRGDEAPLNTQPSRTTATNSSAAINALFHHSNILLNPYIPTAKVIDDHRPHYSLHQLCDFPQDRKQEKSEVIVLNWLKEHFKEFQDYTTQNHHETVKCFGYLSSSRIKPDASLFYGDIPLLLCEVHSSCYVADICKCVISLVFQLRVLRLCDADIDSVCGFVFPNDDEETLVTMVEVKWNNLVFKPNYTYLKQESVIDKIGVVLKSQCTFSKANYFMALSSKELSELEGKLKCTSSLVQVESKFSILVRDDQYYYKLVPSVAERENLRQFREIYYISKANAVQFKYLSLPIASLNVYSVSTFFQYESHPHHFETLTEVKECSVPFLTEALNALKELHDLDYAHTDVILPNFCVSRDYQLMLIDFDRSQPATSWYRISDRNFLYQSPTDTALSLDYKQLGLLILSIQQATYTDMACVTQNEVKLKREHPFISRMIFDGIYEATLFH